MLAPRIPPANEGIHALAAARPLALPRTQAERGTRRAIQRPGPAARGGTLVMPNRGALSQDQAVDEEALTREFRPTDLDHSRAIVAAARQESRQAKTEEPQGNPAADLEPGSMRARCSTQAARERWTHCSLEIRNRGTSRRRIRLHALAPGGNSVRPEVAPRRVSMPLGSDRLRHRRHLGRDQHRPPN